MSEVRRANVSQVGRANERARAGAKKAGRGLYQHQVLDIWPACVECGCPIRTRLVGRDRECACPGRLWQVSYTSPGGYSLVPVDTVPPLAADTEEPTDA